MYFLMILINMIKEFKEGNDECKNIALKKFIDYKEEKLECSRSQDFHIHLCSVDFEYFSHR